MSPRNTPTAWSGSRRGGGRGGSAPGLLCRGSGTAWRILAITFTNKAAGELKSRLEATLGDEAQDIQAATFHSACVRILRREIERVGYESNFTIYDTDDSLRLIKEACKTLRIDEKNFTPRSLLTSDQPEPRIS